MKEILIKVAKVMLRIIVGALLPLWFLPWLLYTTGDAIINEWEQ